MRSFGRLTGCLCLVFGSGCYSALNTEEVRRGLHEIQPLEQAKRIKSQPVPLEKVPMEPKDAVFVAAQQIFAAAPNAAQGPAPAKLKMTVDDVRANALANNLELKVSRLDAGIFDQLATAEHWKFEPRLAATITYNVTRDSEGPRTKTAVIEPSIQIPNHLGGTVTLSYPHTAIDLDRESMFTPDVVTTGPRIAIDQPLLRFGGLRVAYASVDIADLRARQADARAKAASTRVLALAEQTYWRYYAAYEALRIQLKKYDLAKDQLRFARRLVEEGARTKVEVTRASAGVAREFDGVIRAELFRRQNERELKQVLNMKDAPMESVAVIEPGTGPTPMELTFDRDAVLKLALEKRMDLFENQLQVEIADRESQVALNNALPGLNFQFNYAFQGIGSTFSDATKQIFDKPGDSYGIGVFVDLPLLLDRAGWARQKQALLALKQTNVVRRDLQIGIAKDVLNAVDSIELGWQRVLATRQSLALAQQAYEADKVEFGSGSINATELLIQLDAYTSAQVAFVNAESDYQNALVDVAFATGTIVSEAGVTWQSDQDPD